MREWQLVRVTYSGGAQDSILARDAEAQRFSRECQRKMAIQMKTKEERAERCTGFCERAFDGCPRLVKHLCVNVDDLSGVSVEDWDHSVGELE